MKNLDNLFDEIKKQPVNQPLLSKEELVSIVNSAKPTTFKLSSNIKWISFVAAMVILTSYFLLFNNNSQVDTKQIQSNDIVSSIQKQNEIADNSVLAANNDDNKIATQTNLKQELKKISSNSTPKNIQIGKLINVVNANSISGIKMINLTIEELKSLNIFVSGNTVKFEVEEIIKTGKLSKDNKFKEELRNLNYPVESPEFITQTNISFSNNQNSDNNQQLTYQIERYSEKNNHNFNCTTPVKIEILGSEDTKQLTVFENSPIFKYIETYNDFEDILNENHKSIIDEINNSNLTGNSKLIPVLIKINTNNNIQGIILWYVPTDDFINALPENYKSELKSEMEILNNLENKIISQETACSGVSGSDSFFNICKKKSGSLGKLSIYPNPAFRFTSGKYTLAERRYVKISMHNIEGKFIKEIQAECLQEAGNYEFRIDLEGLNSGNYLIAITTDDCEQVVRRLLIR